MPETTNPQPCVCGEPATPDTVHRSDGPCYVDPVLAAPAVPSAPADRADLRDRIADAIRGAACPGDCGKTEEECATERIQPEVWHHGVLAAVSGTPEQFADVVLAVLPEPVDRAALEKQIGLRDYWHAEAMSATTRIIELEAQVEELRRVADEAQQQEADDTIHACPGRWAGPDCRCFDTEPADEAQQPETQAPYHRWRVETRDPLADEWAPGSRMSSRADAEERYATVSTRWPEWADGTPVERRIVRETTTYTVEQPAAVSQPGKEA